MEKKAYAVYNALERVLSFYYDELKKHRRKFGIFVIEPIENAGWRAYAKEIEKVVFDESFAEYDGLESTMKRFFFALVIATYMSLLSSSVSSTLWTDL